MYLIIFASEKHSIDSSKDSIESNKTQIVKDTAQVYQTSTCKLSEANDQKNDIVIAKQKYLPLSEFYKTELWNSNTNSYITLDELYRANNSEIKNLAKKIQKKYLRK